MTRHGDGPDSVGDAGIRLRRCWRKGVYLFLGTLYSLLVFYSRNSSKKKDPSSSPLFRRILTKLFNCAVVKQSWYEQPSPLRQIILNVADNGTHSYRQ